MKSKDTDELVLLSIKVPRWLRDRIDEKANERLISRSSWVRGVLLEAARER